VHQFMEWPAPPSGVGGLPAVQEEELDMALAAISVLGVDLGKNVCSVVGLDSSGHADQWDDGWLYADAEIERSNIPTATPKKEEKPRR
jgi:hypothetical protein